MRSKIIHMIYLTILILILILPFIQNQTRIINSKKLKGEFIPALKASFQFHDWFEGQYQINTDKFIEENIGFRSDFVRLSNQVDYSFFNQINCDVILGKDNFLFQRGYINSANGLDLVSKEDIALFVNKIKTVQQKLKEKNIDLVLIIAPSKATFYYNYLPDSIQKQKRPETNYDRLMPALKLHRFNIIDFSSYFKTIKNTSAHPLFPSYGIHWSTYGACLAGDSLAKYIEKLRGIDLPDIYWKKIILSKNANNDDTDLEALMNLIFPLEKRILAYPKLDFEKNPTKTRPRVLTIGDSFYLNILNQKIPSNIFSQLNYWYYFHEVYADSLEKSNVLHKEDFMNEVLKQDVIVLIENESNLKPNQFKFIDEAYNYFEGREYSIEYYIQKIKSDSVQLELVKQKANKNSISVDSALISEAVWIFKNTNPGAYKNYKIKFYINRIKNDTTYMNSIKEKSRIERITIDEMLERDALWLFENEK